MRTILILAMFTASLANGGWSDYEEVRELALEANGVAGLEIDAGAGSLQVAGVEGLGEISVVATIQVPGASEEEAREIIATDLVLSLDQSGDKALLKGYFEDNSRDWNESPSMRLEVRIPRRLDLDVDDTSGSMTVRDVSGDIRVDDSSGSLKMSNVGGNVEIEDGSGSIEVAVVGGDISIDDGSGSITVEEVTGSVTVDDGSGSISVYDVGQDLIIVDDGSGSINYRNVQGRVEDNS